MNPLRLVHSIDNWLANRRWLSFLLGLPALLVVGLLVFVSVIVLYAQQRRDFDQHYTRLTQWFLASHKYEEARVASLRGLLRAKTDQDRAEKSFFLGFALNGLGRNEEALQLFNLAAPIDHPGYAPAQILIAESILGSTNLSAEALRGMPLSSTNAATETLHKAERHLLNALASDQKSVEANEMLGRYYINTRNPAKARKYLQQIYSAKPEVALLLAISWVQENDEINATLWADRAIGAYEKNLIESAPKYSPEDRLGLVQALSIKQFYAPKPEAPVPAAKAGTNTPPQDSPAFWFGMARLLLANGKHAPALQILEQQIVINSNALYSAAIADICANWAQNITVKEKGGYAARLQLIKKGLAYQPRHIGLQLQLAQATHAPDESGLIAQKLLDDAMAGTAGEAAAWWHFVLWTDARFRGDMPAARQHLQAAYQLAPQIPQIVNDLAMDLSVGSHDDLDRALELIQGLLKKHPDHSGFRDTRGQILFKLGRYSDAIADLEFALPRLGNPVESQQILQKCYSAMGRAAPAPESHVAVLLGEVRTLVGEQKYAEALDKLEKNMHESPNPACASAIADLCATWAQKTPPTQFDKRLQLIQKGLSYSPEDSDLKQLLFQATRAGGESGLAARQLLDQLVAKAEGDAAADWHLSLGQDARQHGDLAAARLQVETASNLAPARTEIKAELAAVLVEGSQEDWEKGLQLIQSALDQFPNSPEFRNTRGLLLAKMGQNKSAAADLEAAAAGLPHPSETRLALAKVYDALGKPQLAAQQRHLAEKK